MTAWIPLLIAILIFAAPAPSAAAARRPAPDAQPVVAVGAEFDGDGRPDEAKADSHGLVVRFMGNAQVLVLSRRGAVRNLVAHDVDRDGDQDLLALGDHGLMLWRNEGKRHFSLSRPRTRARLIHTTVLPSVGAAAGGLPELEAPAPPPPAKMRAKALGVSSDRAGPALEPRRVRPLLVVPSSRSPRAPPFRLS